MALLLNLASDAITKYGTPLFAPVTELGSFKPTAEQIIDDTTFLVDGYYIRLRNSAVKEGITTASDREFTVAEFESTREYEYDGTTYPAGRRVLMAW
jgi:hypothetical protein